ncbi:hypothetical protein CRG98_042984 [Punica granatum]|uniref:Wall-associated receptor kinase galacturonan-binding domain-containing protein n=1 Tax=Punica granatum TaxID=22663 RepID=A0A2I0HY64_PUNGR|nr:hypothetical protein CRG98_042984 [Punica granatum]
MGLELVLLKVLLLWHFHLAGGLRPQAFTKVKCQDSCGGITVPFPFGIGGEGCFLNEWYEIICEGNGTIPRLKRINAEVIKISLPYTPDSGSMFADRSGTIEVNLPIVYSNWTCALDSNRASMVAPNLHGSPFVYSARENVFFAVGSSNLLAVIKNTGPVLAGCSFGCIRQCFSYSGNCSGYGGCCETGISSLVLQEFGVDFLKEGKLISNGGGECGYGFLANESWLRPKLPDLQALIKDGHVPGVLHWGIPHNSSVGVQLSKSCTKKCMKRTLSGLPYPPYEFYCRPGYFSNPYIMDGCRDIDECEDLHLNDCTDICENAPGTYHCKEAGRMVKFVMRGIGAGLGSIVSLLLVWRFYKTMKKK